MKSKAGLIWLVMLLLPFAAHADEPARKPDSDAGQRAWLRLGIGSKAGLGWVTSGGNDAVSELARTTSMLGHVYGAVLAVEPWQRAGLQLELLSATRGWGVKTAEGVDAGTLDVSYLGVTLLGDIKLRTEGPLRPYVLAGAELRYAIRAMRVRPSREPQDLSADITRLDIGVIAGTGLAWELAPRHELIIEARVDIGQRSTDSSEGNDNELLNRSFMIVLGYRYWLLPGDARSDEPDPGR